MPVKMYMTDFTKETVAGRAAISTLELFFLDVSLTYNSGKW